jgi:PTS system cellobiose-specific IIC component
MEKKRLRKQRLIAGMSSLILFLIVVTPQVEFDKVIGFGHTSLGAGGMFIAIFCGIFTGYVMSLFGKFSFFKEDSVIPDFVRSWFDAMLPIAIIICTGWIVVLIMKVDLYNAVLSIFMPLSTFIQSPFGFIIVMFIYCFLYSMGISSWVLTPVTSPVFLAAITANIAMAQAGTATAANLNLATSSTIYSAYLWVGGIGCTLPLVIMLIRSKAKKLSALGKACLVPSIFNINEPVVFGTIAWNPYLMIPMWIQGIVLPVVTYIFTKVIPFAPIPTLQFEMWYCPFPISTWITTGSISGILLLVVNVVISATIWYPFFKAYEAQEIKALNEQEAAN